jgi:hypothetical protein
MDAQCPETRCMIRSLPVALSCSVALPGLGRTLPLGVFAVPAVLAGDLAAPAVLAGDAGAWPGSTMRGITATVPEGGAGGKTWQNEESQHYRPQRLWQRNTNEYQMGNLEKTSSTMAAPIH